MTPPVDPNQVLMTGENSFIRLSSDGGKTMTDRLSHWRVLWCPDGAGHALFVHSTLLDGGRELDRQRLLHRTHILTLSRSLLQYFRPPPVARRSSSWLKPGASRRRSGDCLSPENVTRARQGTSANARLFGSR